MTEQELGDFLRSRRVDLGLTKTQVSEGTGIQVCELIDLIEKGQRRPPLEKLPDIARVLELDAKELIIRWFVVYYPMICRVLFPDGVCTIES